MGRENWNRKNCQNRSNGLENRAKTEIFGTARARKSSIVRRDAFLVIMVLAMSIVGALADEDEQIRGIRASIVEGLGLTRIPNAAKVIFP